MAGEAGRVMAGTGTDGPGMAGKASRHGGAWGKSHAPKL